MAHRARSRTRCCRAEIADEDRGAGVHPETAETAHLNWSDLTGKRFGDTIG